MRGAWDPGYEYIFELHPERQQVGGDGMHHVIGDRVLLILERQYLVRQTVRVVCELRW